MKKLPTYENEQFIINENDNDAHLYDKGGVAPFDLDLIDFIMPDDLGSSSRAFPPLAYPDNTPALLPNGQNQYQNQALNFQLPLLPGQNEKSYNEEHFYHRQRQQSNFLSSRQSFSQNSSGVRPDAVFTPLVSPAVTPMELQVNSNKNQSAPMQATFEPLTSPALNAQQRHERSSDRRRPLLATFGADDYSGSSSTKRRTPHSTPNLSAHPHQKTKRSPSLRKTPQAPAVFEQLPDSSYDASMDGPSSSHSAKSTEATPMLPPHGKRAALDGSLSGANTPGYSGKTPSQSGVGPATLMGFTMNRFAELQSNTNNLSPSLEPRNGHREDSISSNRSSISGHRVLVKNETSLLEPSPAIDPQTGEESGRKREKGPGKKASHKIAEQGRRNRMNQAVHDLANLIPQDYHEQVSIPSKATTIELASKYITELLAELEEVKAKVPQDELPTKDDLKSKRAR